MNVRLLLVQLRHPAYWVRTWAIEALADQLERHPLPDILFETVLESLLDLVVADFHPTVRLLARDRAERIRLRRPVEGSGIAVADEAVIVFTEPVQQLPQRQAE